MEPRASQHGARCCRRLCPGWIGFVPCRDGLVYWGVVHSSRRIPSPYNMLFRPAAPWSFENAGYATVHDSSKRGSAAHARTLFSYCNEMHFSVAREPRLHLIFVIFLVRTRHLRVALGGGLPYCCSTLPWSYGTRVFIRFTMRPLRRHHRLGGEPGRGRVTCRVVPVLFEVLPIGQRPLFLHPSVCVRMFLCMCIRCRCSDSESWQTVCVFVYAGS